MITGFELFPGMHILFALTAFVLGACMGSFFNVCIYRIPRGQSIFYPPRSFCFSCGSMIEARDNIPLVSYVRLHGVCRHCGSVYSSRYFWIECLCGLLFLWAYMQYGVTPSLLAYWTFIGLMVIATFTDIDNWIIPDRISIGGTAVGIAFSSILPFYDDRYVLAANELNSLEAIGASLQYLFVGAPDWVWSLFSPPDWLLPFANAVLGAAFGFGMLWGIAVLGKLMFRKEAMGFGDVKLFACLGAFLGWLNSIYVLMLASIMGSIIGGGMMLYNKLAARASKDDGGQAKGFHPLPFGPYIAFSALFIMLLHPHLPKIMNFLATLGDPLMRRFLGIE